MIDVRADQWLWEDQQRWPMASGRGRARAEVLRGQRAGLLVTLGALWGAAGAVEVLTDVQANQRFQETRRRVANGDGD